MATFPNVLANPMVDGILYASAVVVPAAEGALGNRGPAQQDPVPVLYNEAISAIVELTAQGAISSQTTYVVLQTDFGDGVWIDVAWLAWTGISGSATFLLAGGVAGANSFQQTRASGTAPSPTNSSNQIPLGGRIRFVGKSTVNTSSSSSSSSSSSGGPAALTPGVLATIRFKLLGLR